MPVTGRKQKPEGERRNRTKPTHDWTDVLNVEFTGKPPVSLPAMRRVRMGVDVVEVKLHPQTRAWWRTISRMPHCVLWTDADWRFALETALLVDDLFQGDTAKAGELRQREKIIGTTMDARRDLRIRYVDPQPEIPEGVSDSGSVARLSDRRSRLVRDAS